MDIDREGSLSPDLADGFHSGGRQGTMRAMPKKPPRTSPGRSRNRSTMAFWGFIVLAIITGAVMYRAATTRGPSDTSYRSSDTLVQATPGPVGSAVSARPPRTVPATSRRRARPAPR